MTSQEINRAIFEHRGGKVCEHEWRQASELNVESREVTYYARCGKCGATAYDKAPYTVNDANIPAFDTDPLQYMPLLEEILKHGDDCDLQYRLSDDHYIVCRDLGYTGAINPPSVITENERMGVTVATAYYKIFVEGK